MKLTFEDLPHAVEEILERLKRIEGMLDAISNDKIVAIERIPENLTMNTTELAKYLKCTPMTVYNYIKRGAIPYFKVGNKKYFKKSEIDRALKVK